MRTILAIIAGCAFIVITILLLQLVYIFVAVAYNALAKDYPFLNEIVGSFRYVIGIPIFIVTMFIGGYVTASIANIKASIRVWLNCMSVGLITSGAMIYPALENSEITGTGIVVFTMALAATMGGGLYWRKNIRVD